MAKSEYRQLQAECRTLSRNGWLPVGFKCTANCETLRTAIEAAKLRRDPSQGSRLGLVNDLLEIIGYYAPPFTTMRLVTLDRNIAGRLAYSGSYQLWKQKIRVERKGRILDDEVIGTKWYIYYRTINRQLDGGRAYFSGGGTGDVLVAEEVSRISVERPSSNFQIDVLTRDAILVAEYNPHSKAAPLKFSQSSRTNNRTIETLDGVSRSGLKPVEIGRDAIPKYGSDFRAPRIESSKGLSIVRDGRVSYHSRIASSFTSLVEMYSQLQQHIIVNSDGTGAAIPWDSDDYSILRFAPIEGVTTAPQMLPVSTNPKGGPEKEGRGNISYLNVYPVGTANVITATSWVGHPVDSDHLELNFDSHNRFAATPYVVRAVWGSKSGEVLVLDPDGRIHLYNLKLKTEYRGVVDLPLCCDLVQVGSRYAYVTVA